MKPLLGKMTIDWVLDGVLASAKKSGIVVSIPDRDIDLPLAEHCQSRSIDVFRGSEADVLGRYAEASQEHPYDHILRVTADCPLVSGAQLDALIDYYFASTLDYASNHIPTEQNLYPDGFGGELFSRQTLLEIAAEASAPRHREHVTLYLRDHPQRYTLGGPLAAKEIQYPRVKLDIDTTEDFDRMERLLSAFPNAAQSRPTDKEICEKFVELFL